VATFYSNVLGLNEVHRDDDHILLESPVFQLVVHRIPGPSATTSDLPKPSRRGDAAFKPVFFIPDLTRARTVTQAHGGTMEPRHKEWSFNGTTVCDAVDPEGNVIQFRETGALTQ
jgi:catechol 2,3-dioxygenase-like lactoylglutathione lyase family enzyme